MTDDEKQSSDYVSRLRDAIDAAVAREVDWPAFYVRLNAAVAPRLGELRRRASNGYRATAVAGGAWWDYAARAALAAVPLGLVAAVLLFTYLRSSAGDGSDAPPRISAGVAVAGGADAARNAFDSVLTATTAPQAVISTLIPVPSAAFLAESASGVRR
jgi:hypothetical protein